MATRTVEEVMRAVTGVFTRAGVAAHSAAAAARALVAAEAAGLGGHGLSRVAMYVQHVADGRVSGTAQPLIARDNGAAFLVDAKGGLAYAALELAGRELVSRARRYGVAYGGITGSHHCGAMDYHLAPLAAAGLVGLGFTNSPAAINAWGCLLYTSPSPRD